MLSRLFAEGALAVEAPPLAAGELRVAGATLSAGAAQLYMREKGRWLKTMYGKIAPGKWLKPCGDELPEGVDIEQLRPQVAKLLGIPEVRRPAACAPEAARADAACAVRYQQSLCRDPRASARAASSG